MIVDVNKKILIVGLGLLGGSYAKALRRFGFHISAITKERSSIDYAIENGIIDEGSTSLDPSIIGAADIVIFALYPHVFVEWIEKNGHLLRSGTVITDVTGVKSAIVSRVQDMLPEGVEFIAAHPMAGREVYGVENSDDGIFRGANFIVTPTDKNTQEAIDICRELGELLGFAHVAVLSPTVHDRMIAFLSQLTHCIAVALMTCNDNKSICDYTGDSFRDLTRIARINEDMWTELFLINKDPLVSEIKAFIGELEKMRRAIETDDEDTLKKMMRTSTERRALFDKKV